MDTNEEITLESIVNHNDRLLNIKRNPDEKNSALVVKGTSNEEKTKEQIKKEKKYLKQKEKKKKKWYTPKINSNIYVSRLPNDITTDASYLFDNCYSLQQVPTGFSNIRCTNLANAFSYCSNLSGNIYIGSDSVSNATGCFNGTSLPKNVYIPFTYANGVNTQTYNTFNAIYGTGANGVTLLNYTALYE